MKALLRFAAGIFFLAAATGPMSRTVKAACDPYQAGLQCYEAFGGWANYCQSTCPPNWAGDIGGSYCVFDGDGCFVYLSGNCVCRDPGYNGWP
jgi:hypothetical protein